MVDLLDEVLAVVNAADSSHDAATRCIINDYIQVDILHIERWPHTNKFITGL